MWQADPHVEPAGADGQVDGQAPEHTGFAGPRVVMGEGADGPGRVGDGVAVAEVGESDRSGPHQRAVPGGPAGPLVQLRGPRAHRGGARRLRGEDRTGLRTDIGRPVGVPAAELRCDRVQRRLGAQVRAGRGHQRDRAGHLGVVRPLTGGDTAEATAEHQRLAVERAGPELVRDTEGVAGGAGQQDPDGPVGPLRVQAHQAATSS